MRLEDLRVYQLSMNLSDSVWQIVTKWDFFAKDTLVKSADSVSANLSEGFGRYFYKEEKQFCYYARGSLFETKTWLTKALKRGLISNNDFLNFEKEINDLGIKLNNYIKTIGKNIKNNE